jgi:hypothetical protein
MVGYSMMMNRGQNWLERTILGTGDGVVVIVLRPRRLSNVEYGGIKGTGAVERVVRERNRSDAAKR